jgi:hypothetical protein
LNGQLIENHVGPGVSNETAAIVWERELFGQVKDIKNEIGKNQGFLLMSMATSVPYEQMFYSAMMRFLPERSSQEDILKCAAAFNIPGTPARASLELAPLHRKRPQHAARRHAM